MALEAEEKFVFPQWFTGFGVTLLMIQLGIMSGWTSPTLAYLMGPHSPIHLTNSQASWLASLVNIGRLFGAVLGPVITNYFGSKRTIFITLFPMAVGWLIIALANCVEWLYVARISSGLGLGMAFGIFPLYIGEVSMPEIRGALISLAICGAPFGQIVSSICSSYLSMTLASSIYFSHCLLLMFLFLYLPESPYHLVKVGNRNAAIKSINWYRSGKGVDVELEAVEKFIASRNMQTFIDNLREFKSPPIRRAIFQIIALYTFMQWCGLNSIIFYMEIILAKTKFDFLEPSSIVILVNVFGTLSSALSIFLIDRCGRRFLLLISSIGVTISMLILMTQFILNDLDSDKKHFQWLSMSAMFLFIISFCIGLMPVPSAILSETFPANFKCIAACIAGLTGGSMAFLSAKSYQPLVDLMGEKYVYMIYAICSGIVIPYVIFIMHETKGKSLQQIQDELMNE